MTGDEHRLSAGDRTARNVQPLDQLRALGHRHHQFLTVEQRADPIGEAVLADGVERLWQFVPALVDAVVAGLGVRLTLGGCSGDGGLQGGQQIEVALARPLHILAAVARERRDGGQIKLSTFIPLKIRRRGASKVVVRPDGQVEAAGKVTTQHDQPLLVALTRAFYWQHLLDGGVVASGSEIAQREGLHHSTVNELLRLTLLEPAIIQAILAGKQPRCMSLLWFQRNPLPTDWAAQRQILARFDA